MWQDWCPLCGSRFEASSPEELTQKIVDHIDSGYCEQHFVPLAEALADNCFEAKEVV